MSEEGILKDVRAVSEEGFPRTIKEYDTILKGVRALVVAKNADYGDSWRIMRPSSITDQILVKAYRIRSIEESEGLPKVSEGIASEYRDILNYCVFALIKLAEGADECPTKQ